MAKNDKKTIVKQLLELGFEESDLKGKKVEDLKYMLDSGKQLESAQESTESVPVETSEDVPSRTHPGWTDYVLSFLDKDKEMDNGNPRTDGLRRVAEMLYGTMNSETKVLDTPRSENAFRAVVLVTVSFENGIKADGAVDVYSGNTEKTFAVHPVATAETRAEGRALRKALRLTKVLAAEELQNADKDEPTGIDNRAPREMISGLKVMCGKANIDLVKLAIQSGMQISDPEDLTQVQGAQLGNIISKITRGEITRPEGINNV